MHFISYCSRTVGNVWSPLSFVIGLFFIIGAIFVMCFSNSRTYSLHKTRAIAAFFLAALTKTQLQLLYSRVSLKHGYRLNLQLRFLKNAAISQLQLRFSKCGYRSSQIIFFKGDLQLRFLKTQLQPTYSCVFFLKNAAIDQLQPHFYNVAIGPVK